MMPIRSNCKTTICSHNNASLCTCVIPRTPIHNSRLFQLHRPNPSTVALDPDSSQTSLISASNSSSLSQPPPPLRFTTIFCSSFSFCSATAPRISISCSSLTFCRIWPVRASMIRRSSTSRARDSFTRRIRPRRSDAGGVRIWERMEARWDSVGEG